LCLVGAIGASSQIDACAGRSKHCCWWHEEAVAYVAPFGHAVESDSWLFLKGQMPFTDTSINALCPDGIEAQTHAMMAKPTTVLAGCGLGSL
jgi:enamine deaminase RidA (YjgF/YER057c/UK114 family)